MSTKSKVPIQNLYIYVLPRIEGFEKHLNVNISILRQGIKCFVLRKSPRKLVMSIIMNQYDLKIEINDKRL